MINARAKTVADKPAFCDAFRRRRCLVPADGYYEWQPGGRGPKQPYRITLKGGEPFSFVGLWDRWQGPEGPIDTCTIITTTAPESIEVIHDRMPVILDAAGQDSWLDHRRPRDVLLALLVPVAAERIAARPVSGRLNVNVARGDKRNAVHIWHLVCLVAARRVAGVSERRSPSPASCLVPRPTDVATTQELATNLYASENWRRAETLGDC